MSETAMPPPPTLSPTAMAAAVAGLMVSRLETFTALSTRHPQGVVVRLPTRRLLVVSSPSAIKHVLMDNADNYRKGIGQAEARRILGDGLLTSEGATWTKQRQAVTPALRARRVQGLISDYARLASENVAPWASADWHEVPVAARIAQYTLDCLGHTLGFSAPPAGELMEAFEVVQRRAMFDSVSAGMLTPWVRPREELRLRRARRHLTKAATTTLSTMTVNDPQPAWATVDGLVSLFLAGYETTASVLTWAVYYLGQRPDLQARIAREASRLPDPDRITIADSGGLRVAAATFRETLRLRPPVWLISRRATGSDNVDGMRVNPGDDVAICTHALQRDPRWRRPLSFDPDRKVDTSAHPQYLPFGMGPRACPGGSLADLEATLWLSLACKATEFAMQPGTTVKPAARLSQSVAGGYSTLVRGRSQRAEPEGDRVDRSP